MWLKLLGTLLMIVGFFLTPFIIGIPIMLIGWFVALAGFVVQLTHYVPKEQREKITTLVKESYRPYHRAAKSLAATGRQMLQIAFVVFIFLMLGTAALTKKLGWW